VAPDPHGQSMAGEIPSALRRYSVRPSRFACCRPVPPQRWLYGGLDGWFHGDDKAGFTAHGWDLADPATRRKVRTLADQVIEVRDGDEVGYGIIEYGVGKGYAMYESVQEHPPI
jgi:hypothetical protein